MSFINIFNRIFDHNFLHLLAPPGFGFPGMPGGMPLAPAPPVMEIPEDEPLSKKPRQEDHLIPEDIFMQNHKVRLGLLNSSSFVLIFGFFRAPSRCKSKFRMFPTNRNGS